MQESHGIVVTDLAFLPESGKSQALRGDNEVALVSVAVDSRCQMHTVPNRSKIRLLSLRLYNSHHTSNCARRNGKPYIRRLLT